MHIPLEDLADEFRPPNDPQRVKLQMDRLLASKYRSSIHSRDLAGMTVILDPGHGGSDIGTRKNGVWEDDTVYDIAVRQQEKLRRLTAARVRMTVMDRSQKDRPHKGRFTSIDRDEVILTTPRHAARDPSSRAVSVNLRAFLASSIYRESRRKGGNDEQILFISLHADALHPSVRGAMVYIPGERFLRRRYGASGRVYRRYREVREKPYMSFNRSQRLRSEGLSRQLAEQIVRSFKRMNLAVHPDQPIRDHIVRRGRSWVPAVLRGNQVPIKILVEVANIASKKDSRLLSTSKQRDKMAAALFDAILKFYQAHDRPDVS